MMVEGSSLTMNTLHNKGRIVLNYKKARWGLILNYDGWELVLHYQNKNGVYLVSPFSFELYSLCFHLVFYRIFLTMVVSFPFTKVCKTPKMFTEWLHFMGITSWPWCYCSSLRSTLEGTIMKEIEIHPWWAWQ